MIWEQCQGSEHVECLRGVLYRLVESQEQVATRHYVDSLDEQALLEDLLETVKPPVRDGSEGYHYLLKTPFRYPPLRWGSRFGQRHEQGIFYGGRCVHTTLSEAAFYRLVFFESMIAPPPKSSIVTQHTLFSARYDTAFGVALHRPPFDAFYNRLTDRQNYSHCQQIGSSMRDAGVQAFEYASARVQGGVCVGLFTPLAFAARKPLEKNAWLCEVSADSVQFKAVGERQVIRFSRSQFCIGDKLPLPAA